MLITVDSNLASPFVWLLRIVNEPQSGSILLYFQGDWLLNTIKTVYILIRARENVKYAV